jgi:predicted O-methyltransferase YrrM
MTESAEPTSLDAANAWIRARLSKADEFADVASATEAHRIEHGCDTFAGGDGPLLQVLAAAIHPTRILEVGTGLGYSGLHLVTGAGAGASLDTVEHDAGHAELALAHFATHRQADHVRVHVGEDLDVLATFDDATFDLAFYDAAVPTPAHLLAFGRVLATDGVLLSSNLFLGQHVPDDPRLPQGAAYREALFGEGWRTAFVGGKALSVRR